MQTLRVLARQVMVQLDLKRALLESKVAEARHRAIVDSATDYAIIVTDLDGFVTEWSSGAERILGWTEMEMVGQTIDRIFTAKDRTEGVPDDDLAQARRVETASDERWHLHRSGTRFWASGEVAPLRGADGVHVGYVRLLRDRTEQHVASKALEEAETRLRRAQEAGGIGVFAVGLDGLLHATPEFCRLYGMAECESAPAEDFERLVIPEDRELVSSDRSRASGTPPLDVQHRIRKADTGELRWIARKGEVERDEEGNPVRFAGVARDITDQVLASVALTAERELLAQMFEQAPTFMALLKGDDHQVERANPGYIALIDGRDVVGMTVAEALPDAAAQGYVDLLDQVYRTGIAYRADGKLYAVQAGPGEPVHERFVNFVYQPIRDAMGEVIGIFVEGADVTDQTLASQALRFAEERYRIIMNSIDVGFCIIAMLFDEHGVPKDYRFVETNGAFERHTGLTDAVGRTMREMQPDYEQHWFDAYGKVALSGEAVRFENGAASLGRWWDVHALPIGDRDERQVALLFSDITGRRAMEERLKELNTTLEQQVQERTQDLMQAEEQLRQSQKMEAVGQLTGGIAHDFNNMLTGVIGSIDLIQRHMVNGRLDRVDKYLDAASSSAHRAAALTARLLAFGRRQSLDLQPTDLNLLVSGMEDLLRRTLGEQVILGTQLTSDVWAACTDVNQMESALLNLCINARDAMPQGGSLTIETGNYCIDDRKARLEGLKSGDYVALTVRDTGQGMTPETVGKVFEPFFTTKPVGEGTGLGLSMIYGFARQAGGHVHIESELGTGTSVTIYMPRFEGAVETAADEGSEAPLGAGETVMVVEDDASVRMIILDVLAELGYHAVEAVEAVDGAAAMPILLSDAKIDLLVTDVGLPGINGRQLAETARRKRPDLKILFVTGYAQNASVRAGFLDTGMEMLTKPFAVDVLATRIRAMLEMDALVGP